MNQNQPRRKNEDMNVTVVLADDHEIVRSGLSNLLGGSGIDVVAEAKDGDEAISLTKTKQPDVLLMDIRMPTTNGIEALERLKVESPTTQVVMLSTYDNPTYVARSAALGAADYLMKGASKQDLINAILRAARQEGPDEGSVLKRIKSTMAKKRTSSDGDIPLTNRETQVLRHIALGLSNREIGRSLGISIETVKEHVQNILRKLDVNDRTQAAVWAVKRGIV